MQNLGKVKFDPPKVPVIFVLGELLIFKLHKKHINHSEYHVLCDCIVKLIFFLYLFIKVYEL